VKYLLVTLHYRSNSLGLSGTLDHKNSQGYSANSSAFLQDFPFFLNMASVVTILSQAYKYSFSLFSKPNNNQVLSCEKGTIHMLEIQLPLVFGEHSACGFCRSMCSNNGSNTFSRYTIPDTQRTIFRSSHIQAPSTRVAHLAPTSMSMPSRLKLNLSREIPNAV
jgi:hypothetical protein